MAHSWQLIISSIKSSLHGKFTLQFTFTSASLKCRNERKSQALNAFRLFSCHFCVIYQLFSHAQCVQIIHRSLLVVLVEIFDIFSAIFGHFLDFFAGDLMEKCQLTIHVLLFFAFFVCPFFGESFFGCFYFFHVTSSRHESLDNYRNWNK